MHYLYDIWVNWFDGKTKGYEVCPYHEWRKSDPIEMIDQIPVLLISTPCYHTIENSLASLPDGLLASIHKKAYIRKGYGRRVVPYACILSDGKNVLAIDTNGYDRPFRKSRLIPRQERQVFDICEKMSIQHFKSLARLNQSREIWDVDPQFMVGLTRRERKLKQLLCICLHQLRRTQNKNEMCYWLSEWKGKNALRDTRHLHIDEIWQGLYAGIIEGWTDAHEAFLDQITRHSPILRRMWEVEEKDSQQDHIYDR